MTRLTQPGPTLLRETLHLIDSPVLDRIHDLVGVVTPSRCVQNRASPFVDVIHHFGTQVVPIAGVEPPVPALESHDRIV